MARRFRPHRNRQLFSEHYLDHVLTEHAAWPALASAGASQRAALAALYAAYQPTANEAQLEHNLVRPVLDLLGHTYEVQPSLTTPDGTKRPDYVLYPDDATLGERRDQTLTEASLAGALAVADAKAWDRPLDQTLTGAGDPFTNKNPGYQISFYVQHSGLDWGILTNGRRWRLYHRATAHRLDHYYEVDLPDLLEFGRDEDLAYFTAFFGRQAFADHALGLPAMLRASLDYAAGLSDGLKAQVYDALRHVAQGFLDHSANQLGEADLDAVYESSLILLYRLLFVLYAEARDLLPLARNDAYRLTYSLDAVKKQAADTLGHHLLPGAAALWGRLRELFRIIDQGEPPLGVATFNGGLFDAERHTFLAAKVVGDRRLSQAVDKLSRVGGRFVDYRDLAVRHLGTIYEGLLEFRLRPLPPDHPERRQGWTVELVTDRGERHATGSYYTPDFVTRYMVEQAVGPVIDRALAEPDPVQAVHQVNVLDCAMGSGHFLVETVDYIAQRLVAAGLSSESADDLASWRRRMAQSCIYGVDLNPLAVDLAKLAVWLVTTAEDRPLSFLDHHLRCGNALLGARYHDFADPLADSGAAPVAKPKRNGKARAQAELEANGQMSMMEIAGFVTDIKLAVDWMWLIEDSAARNVAEVKEQERLYQMIRAALSDKYREQADAYVATRLDPVASASELAARYRFFHWELEFPEVFFDRFGRHLGEQGGFEVVIGNPPYVRQEELSPIKPYLQWSYPNTYHGMADLFVYFFDRGLNLLQTNGRFSFITSNAWLQTAYAGPLRRHIRETTTVETLIDLGNNRTFAEAPDVCPSIFMITKRPPDPEHRLASIVFARGERPDLDPEVLEPKTQHITQHDQPDTGWQLTDDATRGLLAKLMNAGRPLGEVVGGRMYYGVKTGLNEAFIIDQATRDALISADGPSAEVLKPLVRGEDLRPWYQEDEGRWLIRVPSGWTSETFGAGLAEATAWERFGERFPAVAAWLEPFTEKGRKRQDKGEFWWELRSCVYYDAFEGPKVFWPDICKIPRWSWDESGRYINDKGFIIGGADPGTLAQLQSRLAWLATSFLAVHNKYRGGLWEYQLKKQFVERLPVLDLTPPHRDALSALAMELTELARARYALHQQARHRFTADLGEPGQKPNQKLTAWWDLDFAGFRAELHKAWRAHVAVKERDQWETWLAEQRAEHERLTSAMVDRETELNDRVYRLYGLSPAEIKIVEETTKYRYGEV